MTEDEVFVFIACAFFSLFAWLPWLVQAAFYARRCSKFMDRWTLYVYPLLCTALLLFVLRVYASWDVREAPEFILLYLLMGAAWVGMAAKFLPLFGLSARDDVIERANPAAAHAIGGALIGLTLCFAGGNIGNGPGWWVVVFSAALSTVTFFLLWALLHRFTHLADTVTIERDPASGLRLAGYFIGSGLILGRAVAGNWVSAEATVADFLKMAWPVLLLWAAAALLERTFRPTHERPLPSPLTYGLAPLAAYVALAAFFVAQAGWWS
ncbi:MAG TPA: hypothetical protein VE078_20295 [Thermoanaerobaculia bacterium]|nr:hypothetical protein [Thermoanaerobaculia bacterium]